MLKPQVYHQQSNPTRTLLRLTEQFIPGNGQANSFHFKMRPKTRKHSKASLKPRSYTAMARLSQGTKIKVKAIVNMQRNVGGSLGIDQGLDGIQDLLGETFLLELISVDLDSESELEKQTIKGYAHRKLKQPNGYVKYEADFEVPPDFGEVGAIFVENGYHTEVFLQDIVVNGLRQGSINVACGSWIHSKYKNKRKRVFFTNKAYIPSQTPSGLRRLREEELIILRGNGLGERQAGDRIYDYDVYNDIGDPDKSSELARPVLGGKKLPYPRRCRTGRPRSEIDPSSETRKGDIYLPRDEVSPEVKQIKFYAKTLASVIQAVLPSIGNGITSADHGFEYLASIESLFDEKLEFPPQGSWKTLLPQLFKAISMDNGGDVLRFEMPETMKRDKFCWFRDGEFGRQTLAGVNPYSIKLVMEWPIKSKLDPEIYGPPESMITAELIEAQIGGLIKVHEAIEQRKLFILDYHDLLLPFVSKVREIEGTTLYGSRTLFFLTPEGTLRPLAIELTRPPTDGNPQWRQVFTPCDHSTGFWLWMLAKAHVLAHDSGYHQLVSHWLRTHCVVEPYIIAANRQLSVMHPVFRLLRPHFRNTMATNAVARQSLINAGGTIESSFSPGKYSMEICSVAYDKLWRFDHEALPNDLISRGMAVEDPTAPHGLKLTIEDYPFANDGLILWDAIKQWVSDYVHHYYPDPSVVACDEELQAWWAEIRTVGHADKKDEPWWPELKTPHNLIDILATIIWVASAHHAAVNFGQYTYAGYFPNRPTIARIKMPTEDPTDEDWNRFLEKPDAVLLETYPSKLQATTIIAALYVLSYHSPSEEYIGEHIEAAWADDPTIKTAFEKFNRRLKELEEIINERNANPELKNRNGAGIVPYELLKPFSKPGVTGKGVPYSISN
ncbi:LIPOXYGENASE [Salix koriyanagi]|uniref:Lipoxygenase n=1 Tax=Salix koriyanagi TaxID=2511006 RepID=A0A9Q0QA22_9ROSI|nr:LIPOXYGENASE [Salix koriyanagi]